MQQLEQGSKFGFAADSVDGQRAMVREMWHHDGREEGNLTWYAFSSQPTLFHMLSRLGSATALVAMTL